MPSYQFACPNPDCGHIENISLPIENRNDIQVCPCGESMRRKLSNIGIGFKGAGFYKTDNRR